MTKRTYRLVPGHATADKPDHGQENAAGWLASIEEMLAELETADDDKRESAEQTIHESVLSVMVRDGWRNPGINIAVGAEEYEILLTTGDPALRIWGKIGLGGEPKSAELQHQDWGTPWTRYPAPEATLLAFAQCFYFGE